MLLKKWLKPKWDMRRTRPKMNFLVWPSPYACVQQYLSGRCRETMDSCFELVRPHQPGIFISMGLQKATSPIVAYACSLPSPDDMVVCMQTPLMATPLGWCYACLPHFYPLFLRQKQKLVYISEMSAVQTRHRPTYLPQHSTFFIQAMNYSRIK